MDDRLQTVLKYAAGAAVISAAAVVAAKGMEYLADQSALKRTKEELENARKELAAAKAGSLSSPSAAKPSPASAARPSTSSKLSSPSGAAPAAGTAGAKRKPVRVYMDGVFDLLHYGHSNALRQARAVGDVLVVGLVNDDEVVKNKGTPPVMPEQERYLALSGCKFVDEVIRDAPYDLTEEWVNKLVNEHQIDYIVHGDDPCITADGKDAYAYAKRIGKYKSIKRTEGVSTTDIVGRMLLMTREHHVVHHDETPSGASGAGAGAGGSGSAAAAEPVTTSRLERGMRSSSLGSLASLDDGGEGSGDASAAAAAAAPRVPTPQPVSTLPQVQSKFLPTARRIMQFADGKAPKADDTVVYIAGSFDMFNAGHIAALQAARKFGSFLLVGIHDDATVNGLRGHGLPILNLYERTLSLLSCKFVDEVIIGAPWEITDDLIKTMNISVVVRGSMSDATNAAGHEHLGWAYKEREMAAALDRAYAVPKAMGLLKSFESPMPLTALDIIDRILAARATFQKRYEKKSKMEEDYYSKSKEFIQEA